MAYGARWRGTGPKQLPRVDCPSCGGRVPAKSRFCPHCGSRLDDTSATATAVVPPPPSETGPVPVNVTTVEPRFFGVTPTTATLALGIAAVVVGAILVILGELLAGIVVLLVGAGLLAVFLAAARVVKMEEVRDRAAYLGTAVSVRSSARREVLRLRRELDELMRRRRELLLGLGEAVYRGDDGASEPVRSDLAEVDETIAAKEAEIERITTEAQERMSRARLQASPTEVVAVQEPYPPPDEADPPEPARVPEPYPPPGEGDPAEPARIPEPSPPPDEGDRPEPPRPG